jgi:hypothetical protein
MRTIREHLHVDQRITAFCFHSLNLKTVRGEFRRDHVCLGQRFVEIGLE